MKREIKFRGKDIYTEEWIYGNLVNIEEDRYAVLPVTNTMRGDTIAMYEVTPDTVGQFTGIHDTQGKEIYEGDILRISISKNGIGDVRWGEEQAAFIVQMKNSSQWYNLWKGSTIIGNVHDNPELLKGGEK